MVRTRALRLGLPIALGLLLQPHTAAAHVAVKMMKDMNIGYAHGSGLEPPGTAVKGAPFMIFFGTVPSPEACAAACVADLACTGFVHTDDKQEQKSYDNTCYFRTDGCHDPSCDKSGVKKQSHHESGYLYCADDPTQGAGPPGPTKQQLDACGHDEGAGFGALFVIVFGIGSAFYVGGGLAYGKRTGRGGVGARAHPHYRRWEAIAGLVSDGAAFAKTRRRGGGGYAPVPSGAGGGERGQGSPPQQRAEKKERRESKGKEKTEKAEKPGSGRSEKKEKISSQDKDKDSKGSSSPGAAPAPASAPAVAAPAAVGTASAGGGRWVHLPN